MIINRSALQLAVDVHSNVDNWAQNTFYSHPQITAVPSQLERTLTSKLHWLKYYVPPNPTSTVYVTEPIINVGTLAIIYETYHNESYSTLKKSC